MRYNFYRSHARLFWFYTISVPRKLIKISMNTRVINIIAFDFGKCFAESLDIYFLYIRMHHIDGITGLPFIFIYILHTLVGLPSGISWPQHIIKLSRKFLVI